MTPIYARLTTCALLLTISTAVAAPAAAHPSPTQPATLSGYSFNTATPLRLSSHRVTIRRTLVVGERYFYAIHATAGQVITADATVILPPHYDPGPSPRTERLGVQLYNRVRQPGNCGDGGTVAVYDGLDTATHGGPVTARCTIDDHTSGSALRPGSTYYVQTGVGNAAQTGSTLPFALTVTMHTSPASTASPTYSPGSSPSTTAPGPTGAHREATVVHTWPWALVTLAATVAVTLALTSRRLHHLWRVRHR